MCGEGGDRSYLTMQAKELAQLARTQADIAQSLYEQFVAAEAMRKRSANTYHEGREGRDSRNTDKHLGG